MVMNPKLKINTLFGLLAVETVVAMQKGGRTGLKLSMAIGLLLVTLFLVYCRFLGMSIPKKVQAQ